ncbi:aquaporin-3 isoform X2 [Ciona intestinalis]
MAKSSTGNISWRKRISSLVRIENVLLREMLAEFLGTFILLVFGNGAVAQKVLSRDTLGTTLSINWAYGFGVTMAVYVTGKVSGAHINPAVSVAQCAFGNLPLYKLPCYIFSQVFGGFVSGAAVYSIYYEALNAFDGGQRSVLGPNGTGGIFATYPQDYLSINNGLWDQVRTHGYTTNVQFIKKNNNLFLLKVFGTALLVGIIFAVTDNKNNTIADGLTPIIIGLLVFILGTSFGLNCGYAINPARDFGPRLFTFAAGWGPGVFTEPNGMSWWWVPIVGPIIGGLTGAIVYKLMVGTHLPSGSQNVITDEEDDLEICSHTSDNREQLCKGLTKL